jgi:hypothetical protein
MNRDVRVAAAGLVLLLPALVLAGSGVLGLEPPVALIHPVLVTGGMLLAFTLNAMSVLRIRVGQNEGTLVGTISVRVRGHAMNLTALMLSCVLITTIASYLFVENFQPR